VSCREGMLNVRESGNTTPDRYHPLQVVSIGVEIQDGRRGRNEMRPRAPLWLRISEVAVDRRHDLKLDLNGISPDNADGLGEGAK
jgi:hypothetical protein